MRCPTADEIMPALAALLPRGRAWAAASRDGSVMARFFRAIATDLARLEARLCALRAEIYCRTMSETRDWWLTDYGLPDSCDPWADPCTKRLALGATRCEHWAAYAAAAGWSITCTLLWDCGGMAGTARADCATAAPSWPGPVILITVDAAASTAWVAPQTHEAFADCYRADEPVGCGSDISALQCLLERLIPDHIERRYEVINDG
jgi:hypothetical protein